MLRKVAATAEAIPELSKDIERRVEAEFKRYYIYDELYGKYSEDLKRMEEEGIENWISLRSSADIELDVRVTRSMSPIAQQMRDTMYYEDMRYEYEMNKRKAEGLKNALDDALSEAKKTARPVYWKRIEIALEQNLCRGIRKPAGISDVTLKKYRDIAIRSAARNLGYI